VLLQLLNSKFKFSNLISLVKVKVKVTFRLAVYRQLVCLGAKLFETKDRTFFPPKLNPCGISPYVTSSLTRIWVCLLWICLAFRQCTFRTNNMLLKNSCFFATHKSCQHRLYRADHAYLTYLTLQRLPSYLNGRSLTTAKFRSLIFSMSGLTLSYSSKCSFSWFHMTSACFLHNFVI
jgi:hypothetical protein